MATKTQIIPYQESSFPNFLSKLNSICDENKNNNLIVDLSEIDNLSLSDIKLFIDFSKEHQKLKKSFVIVAKNLDFNKIPVKLTVVPTLQEAKDSIEMEEIERDLGF